MVRVDKWCFQIINQKNHSKEKIHKMNLYLLSERWTKTNVDIYKNKVRWAIALDGIQKCTNHTSASNSSPAMPQPLFTRLHSWICALVLSHSYSKIIKEKLVIFIQEKIVIGREKRRGGIHFSSISKEHTNNPNNSSFKGHLHLVLRCIIYLLIIHFNLSLW